MTMLVCTCLGSRAIPAMAGVPRASSVAFSWSFAVAGRLFQRDQARRREHARLPHSAAEPLAVERPPRSACGSHQHRAHRRAEPFDRQNMTVRPCAVIRPAVSSRRGIEHASAVHVDRQPRVRAVADSSITSSGYTVPPAMLCVFSISISPVGAACGPTAGFRPDLVPRQDAVRRRYRPRDAAREPGHHRQLVIQNMAARFADHFLAMLGQQLDCDRVAHRPGGHKQPGFFAEISAAAFFEAVDGGIFAIHVVADLGIAMARRIAAVGLVTVSLRRSIMLQELLKDLIG